MSPERGVPVPEELIDELLNELGRAFDLSARVGGAALGEVVERRLRHLRLDEVPQWGGPGEIAQVAHEEAGDLDFYYRPHLFPGMDEALRLGHQLQFDLLPRSLPAGSPVRAAAVLESYCHLSGDLLGWRLEGRELLVWIADVSGHGVRSGLAAAVLYFLVAALEPGLAPGDLAREISERMLARRNPDDEEPLFATGFWLRVGPGAEARYASAGHPSALLRRRDGSLESLPSTGPPVGLLPDREFGQADLRLEEGDALLLFTDGLVEATDSRGDEFGAERLATIFETPRGSPLAEARAIYEAVRDHRPSLLLDDDLTFLVVERGEGATSGDLGGPAGG